MLRGDLADWDEAALARNLEGGEPDQVLRAVAELARRRDVAGAVLPERTFDAAHVVSAALARPTGALAAEVETAAVAAPSQLRSQSLLDRFGELRFHSLSGQELTYITVDDPDLDPNGEAFNPDPADMADPEAEASERTGEALGLRLRRPRLTRDSDT